MSLLVDCVLHTLWDLTINLRVVYEIAAKRVNPKRIISWRRFLASLSILRVRQKFVNQGDPRLAAIIWLPMKGKYCRVFYLCSLMQSESSWSTCIHVCVPKLFKYPSMGTTELVGLVHPEISEYPFKTTFSKRIMFFIKFRRVNTRALVTSEIQA